MQTIKAVQYQGVVDLCLQLYGSTNALDELIADNIYGDFQLDAMIIPGSSWSYDPNSTEADKKTLRNLAGKQIFTYRKVFFAGTGLETENGLTILTENGQTIIP